MGRLGAVRPGHVLVLGAFVLLVSCGSSGTPSRSSGTSGAAGESTSGSAVGSGSGSTSESPSGSSGAIGVGPGVSLEAGTDAAESDPDPDAATTSSDDGGGAAAPSSGDGGEVTLTLLNFKGSCSVSVNGGPASTAPSVLTAIVPGGATILIAQPASTAWAIGSDPWFGVSQNDGGAAPGTDSDAGKVETTTAIVAVTSNQCVSVCCGAAPSGTGCPTVNPCL
jgi:hypothetical protein